MITSKHIQYVNRNDKKDVMAIANRSYEQLKRIFGAQNLNLARFTTVIDNIQQRRKCNNLRLIIASYVILLNYYYFDDRK